MKFKLGDTVFFIKNNKIKSGIVCGVKYSNFTMEYFSSLNNVYLEESIERSFPKNIEVYAVQQNHDYIVLEANELFLSKEALLDYLQQ